MYSSFELSPLGARRRIPEALQPFMMGISFIPFRKQVDKKGKFTDLPAAAANGPAAAAPAATPASGAAAAVEEAGQQVRTAMATAALGLCNARVHLRSRSMPAITRGIRSARCPRSQHSPVSPTYLVNVAALLTPASPNSS